MKWIVMLVVGSWVLSPVFGDEPATQPSDRPLKSRAEKPLRKLNDIVALVPTDSRPNVAADWTDAAVTHVAESISGAERHVEMRADFSRFEGVSAEESCAWFDVKPIKWSGAEVSARFYLKWEESKAKEFSKVKPGKNFVVIGSIENVEVLRDIRHEKLTKRVVGGPPIEELVEVVVIRLNLSIAPSPEMKIGSKP